MRQIFLDTETTGLSPEKGDRIIEVAAVTYQNRMPVSSEDGGVFHSYINPQRDIDKDAYNVHKLDRVFLSDKPIFADIAVSLMDFLRDAEIVIHNAAFDRGFLDSEFNRLGYPPLEKIAAKIFCSLQWSRKNNHGGTHSLDALCDRFSVDNTARKAGHNALLDVRLLAKVYLQMTAKQTTMRLPSKRSTQTYTGGDVIVLRANESENAAHQQVLQDMHDKEKAAVLFLQNGDTA